MQNQCPFCQAETELTERFSKFYMGIKYSVWCPNCGSKTEWYDNDPWPEKKEWKSPKLLRKE